MVLGSASHVIKSKRAIQTKYSSDCLGARLQRPDTRVHAVAGEAHSRSVVAERLSFFDIPLASTKRGRVTGAIASPA